MPDHLETMSQHMLRVIPDGLKRHMLKRHPRRLGVQRKRRGCQAKRPIQFPLDHLIQPLPQARAIFQQSFNFRARAPRCLATRRAARLPATWLTKTGRDSRAMNETVSSTEGTVFNRRGAGHHGSDPVVQHGSGLWQRAVLAAERVAGEKMPGQSQPIPPTD